MPELPEVETVRRDIVRLFAGDQLQHVTITGARTVRRHPAELLSALEGRTLVDVGRHGKYLLFSWGGGQVMVGHLRMSGQLLQAAEGTALAPHTHAVFTFARSGQLRFVDPRTFGELFLGSAAGGADGGRADCGRAEGAAVGELAHLGPDALSVTAAHLQKAFAGRRAPLKSLLVDQRALAGIGNIYADEICFVARLRGDRPGGSLKSAEIERLSAAVRSVLGSAIEARGSTLPDLGYRDLAGAVGKFQLQHSVYNRLGQPCPHCGRAVTRPTFGARSAFLCPKCQK